MKTQILEGDAFDVLPTLEAGSIDCAVTSPPYWSLRSYLPKGHPLKKRELGSEKTPAEYVANQVEVARLVRRALADHGTYWINIGDSYANGGGQPGNSNKGNLNVKSGDRRNRGIDIGNLCLIPQRLAIALCDDGWLVRSIIVWHKPAAMPASLAGWSWQRCRVKAKEGGRGGSDGAQTEWQECSGCKKCLPHGGYVLRRGSWRPTSSWEPILMLAKTADYFCDGEPVKTAPAEATVSRDQYTRVLDDPDEQFAVAHDHETFCSGANLRDVWTIPSESMTAGVCKECGFFTENVSRLKKRRGSATCPQCKGEFGSHYAAFPSELASRCLQAAVSAKGYCPACGKPWVRVLQRSGGPPTGCHRQQEGFAETPYSEGAHPKGMVTGGALSAVYRKYGAAKIETIDWRPSCNCIGADIMTLRPGRVLDPFMGTGRTLLEARRLGFDATGVELNPSYVKLAQSLLTNEMPLFS